MTDGTLSVLNGPIFPSILRETPQPEVSDRVMYTPRGAELSYPGPLPGQAAVRYSRTCAAGEDRRTRVPRFIGHLPQFTSRTPCIEFRSFCLPCFSWSTTLLRRRLPNANLAS